MKIKLLKPAVLLSLASTLLVACGDRKSATALPSLPSAPVVAVTVQPTLMAAAQPIAPPPMPGGVALAAPLPTPAATTAEASGTVAPQYSGKTEPERLTWALRAYYDDSSRPAISSFEPMVEKKLIKAVPVAPPGKKYVIDLKESLVRLEDAK